MQPIRRGLSAETAACHVTIRIRPSQWTVGVVLLPKMELAMPHVSSVRLLAMRALYLLMSVGLGVVIWPSLIWPHEIEPNATTVVRALLGALGLLALFGLKYPLQMLPLLLFELLWKIVWVVAVALPAWRLGQLGPYGTSTLYECLPALVLFPLVIPWRYVLAKYIQTPAEPWRNARRVREGDA